MTLESEINILIENAKLNKRDSEEIKMYKNLVLTSFEYENSIYNPLRTYAGFVEGLALGLAVPLMLDLGPVTTFISTIAAGSIGAKVFADNQFRMTLSNYRNLKKTLKDMQNKSASS
ncbi:hypothetical protein J4482_03865 [Candidatus Woesearchaeota archaeon]|nr:hypothetical protein [Candidatus Woesearchaeota archaeon]